MLDSSRLPLRALLVGAALCLAACGAAPSEALPGGEADALSQPLTGPTVTRSCARANNTTVTCTGSFSGGTAPGPFTTFWRAQRVDSSGTLVSDTGYFAGSLTQSFTCYRPTSLDAHALGITFLVKDANGQEYADGPYPNVMCAP